MPLPLEHRPTSEAYFGWSALDVSFFCPHPDISAGNLCPAVSFQPAFPRWWSQCFVVCLFACFQPLTSSISSCALVWEQFVAWLSSLLSYPTEVPECMSCVFRAPCARDAEEKCHNKLTQIRQQAWFGRLLCVMQICTEVL